MRRILIVGASLAGVNAAQALREAGFAGEVILLGDEDWRPYDRPPLSKEALAAGDVPPAELRPAAWYADNGIELRLGTRALALDAWRRRVTLADGAETGYDGLIIATGAEPRPLPSPLRAPGVITLRRPEDAAALRSVLAPGARVVIIGAGFIGFEVAATARAAGARVTVVEVATAPLARAFGEQVGDWLARRHRDAGADVRCGQPVRAVAGADGPGYQVVLGDGAVLRADVVVAATGVRPCADWLRGSGLRLGDGVLCDAYCRTSAPGVVAAGDVARWYNPLFDEDMRVEHWTNAVEQGRAAALTLLGEGAPYAPVPYFWSDQNGMRIRFAGRAYAASEVWIEDRGNGSMVALYERDGLIRGALCVDAVRDLAVRRKQILDQERWADVVPAGRVTLHAKMTSHAFRLHKPGNSDTKSTTTQAKSRTHAKCREGRGRGGARARGRQWGRGARDGAGRDGAGKVPDGGIRAGRGVVRLDPVYFLHKLLWELRRDPALAARFRDDPQSVLDGYDLDPVEREAIRARDFRTLYDRGANPYLLYFCALQIGVSRADYYEQLRAGRPAATVHAEPASGGTGGGN